MVIIPLAHMEAHVLDSELTGHGVKVWLAQGAEMGSGAVFWTQSFWLQILGVKNAVEYRKQQKRRGYLPSIADDWQLHGLTFEEHPGGLTGGQLCIRTDMMLPWLLRFQLPSQRRHVRLFSRSGGCVARWLRCSLMGMDRLGDLRLSFMCPSNPAACLVMGNYGAVDYSSVEACYPLLAAYWLRAQTLASFKINDMLASTVVDWFAFCWVLLRVSPMLGSRDADDSAWVKDVLFGIAPVVAYGMDMFVMQALQVQREGARMAAIITKHGKKRLDPLTFSNALARVRAMAGSSSTAMSALVGDTKADQIASMITVELDRQKAMAAMEGTTMLQLNWDPATYSGWSVNLGLAFSVDKRLACNLPCKV